MLCRHIRVVVPQNGQPLDKHRAQPGAGPDNLEWLSFLLRTPSERSPVEDKFKNIDRMLAEAEWEVEKTLMILEWELKRFRNSLESLLQTIDKETADSSSTNKL
jgi:hypothetical protein